MEVIWTQRATERLRAVFDYHHQIAGLRTARHIAQGITNDALRLSNHPNLGRVEENLSSDHRAIRSMVTRKHYKLLYQVVQQDIYIVSLFDCRQNPEKIWNEVEE